MWCGTTRIILQRLHVNDVPQAFGFLNLKINCFLQQRNCVIYIYIQCSHESMNTVRLIYVYNTLLTDATVQFLQRAMEL